MKNNKAIVTLAIGKRYLNNWKKLCESNWQKYAKKHGYDLICIDSPLDTSERAQKRSPAWQKCLILSQDVSQQYERIVWIDSDILINSELAPCIVKDVPIDKVGATNEWASPAPHLYSQALARRNEYFKYAGIDFVNDDTPQKFYSNYGLYPKFDSTVQTGVMVFSPQHHRQILEKVYFEYEEKGKSEWNYEMRPLSWELLNADCVHWIDHRFNLIWLEYLCLHYPFILDQSLPRFLEKIKDKGQRLSLKMGIPPRPSLKKQCANTAFLNSFFLHFAGRGFDLVLVDTKTNLWLNFLK
ncbi:MAG: hypothetical protein U7123_01205 [Potamolinea sp.]